MNEKPINNLISVIVPVYNIEDFIDKCVMSLIKQTYKNIEIILVDDGSTDNSKSKCDYYASIDNRVRVIHKENGGLSDARNAGINISRGDYIAFVDGDDCVLEGMYSYLLGIMLQHQSDIAVCRFSYDINKSADSILKDNTSEKTHNSQEAIKYLYNDNICGNYAWNKLYKRELFDAIRFPKGKYYEDAYIMPQLFLKANTICFTNQCFYLYNGQRPAQITSEFNITLSVIKDHINAYDTRLHDKNLKQFERYTLKDIVTCLKRCKRLIVQGKVNHNKQESLDYINQKIKYYYKNYKLTFPDYIQCKVLLFFNNIPVLFYISKLKKMFINSSK